MKYYLQVVDSKGQLKSEMYSHGETCATPDLARRLHGNIRRNVDHKERIALVGVDESGRCTVLDLEPSPGDWDAKTAVGELGARGVEK